MDKMDLLEYLQAYHKTEDEAISAYELGELFNLDKRGVRLVVTDLRANGFTVCSSHAGYWYSEDEADVSKTIRRLQAQINGTQRAVDGMRGSL
jgi:biotin operon repressor